MDPDHTDICREEPASHADDGLDLATSLKGNQDIWSAEFQLVELQCLTGDPGHCPCCVDHDQVGVAACQVDQGGRRHDLLEHEMLRRNRAHEPEVIGFVEGREVMTLSEPLEANARRRPNSGLSHVGIDVGGTLPRCNDTLEETPGERTLSRVGSSQQHHHSALGGQILDEMIMRGFRHGRMVVST